MLEEETYYKIADMTQKVCKSFDKEFKYIEKNKDHITKAKLLDYIKKDKNEMRLVLETALMYLPEDRVDGFLKALELNADKAS